ncbi:MAG: DNA-3-methyladenine glycosylase [Planctomycetaceae bacterium]
MQSVNPLTMVQSKMFGEALPVAFYERDARQVAAELLGKLLCRRGRRGLTVGRIVETEAYLAEGDSASHSFRGMNRRNASMFGPPGRAYVYTIHARQCVNVVTDTVGVASAVLIRALEPITGIPLMQIRRRTKNPLDLCRGPARLCEALDISRNLDGWPLLNAQRLWIAQETTAAKMPVAHSVRIGVTSAHDQPLRYFLPDNAFVSGPRTLNRFRERTET